MWIRCLAVPSFSGSRGERIALSHLLGRALARYGTTVARENPFWV